MEIKERLCGNWPIRFVDRPFAMTAEMVQDGAKCLAKWQKLFAPEQTWVRENLGVPSLLARIDVTIMDEHLMYYEVEERPSGMGVTSIVNQQFAGLLQEISSIWPDFSIVISPLRRGTDDNIWAKNITTTIPDEGLVLVRAEPEEEAFHHLTARSVSSLQEKGNKSYGLEMGFWSWASNPRDLSWHLPFTVKPVKGSKTRGVHIWHPGRLAGSSSRKQIERAFAEYGSMYCQPFLPPIESGIEEAPWMILRVYYGFHLPSSSWLCLGGCWNARPNLKIHGASDAIFGPVTVELQEGQTLPLRFLTLLNF